MEFISRSSQFARDTVQYGFCAYCTVHENENLIKIFVPPFIYLGFFFLFFFFTVRPLSIKLIGENRPLSAEIPVNVSCRVTGAKPPPKVTWWKDAVQMIDAKQVVSDSPIVTPTITRGVLFSAVETKRLSNDYFGTSEFKLFACSIYAFRV